MNVSKNAVTAGTFLLAQGYVLPTLGKTNDFKSAVIDMLGVLGGTEMKVSESGAEILKKALQYERPEDKAEIAYMSVNVLMEEFVTLTMVISNSEAPIHDVVDLLDDNGVLAYVYNITAPELSELGYVGFGISVADSDVRRIW